ncbi:hypothetical protein NQ318_009274 [Aromia moschata]|uniref:Centrosome-associated protein 350 n=1 Tax=Aromia moschata TaxID=1265417 RepID=A0AAV8YL60_9CUCU|nr:hypothetical protein NQ318_009274 [Aromia moschata]
MEKKYDISSRILETRKQTEELKLQLQNLIDSGINSSLDNNKFSDHSNVDKENLKDAQNKVQIIKSYDPKYSQHVNKPSSSKAISTAKQNEKKTQLDLNKESPKKVRSYDVREAREYIKRQREKRIEQLKAQNAEKIKVDLQKKKLQELHKKSLELVTKNVQASRERSKSRDRNETVRPDQDSRTRARSYSRERNLIGGRSQSTENVKRTRSVEPARIINQGHIEKRNPNLLYPPVPDYMGKLQTTKSRKDYSGKKVIASPKSPRGTQNETKISSDVGDKVDQKNSQIDQQSQLNGESLFVKSTNLGIRSPEKTTNTQSSLENRNTNLLKRQDHIVGFQKVNVCDDCEQIIVETPIRQSYTHDIQKTNDNSKKKPVAYPFNFINSVKRKLQDAVNSKQSVDIGIQSSFREERQKTPEPTKSKEELIEIIQSSAKSSKRSDLRSFISHKCLNLDPKTIDRLELIPKNSGNIQKTVNGSLEPESGSDTSKNIPEISSESGTSSLKQRSPNTGLNIERLNHMKLIPEVKSATPISDIDQIDSAINKTSKLFDERGHQGLEKKSESDKANLLTPNDEYTSDFQSTCDLSRSRESIISFNSPSYSKQIIYTLRSPEYDISPNFARTEHADLKVHSSDIPESFSSKHSKNIPDSITTRGQESDRPSRKVTETSSIKTVILEANMKSKDKINSRSKETVSSKNSSTKSGTETSNSKSKSTLSKRKESSKSSSNIPTEIKSQGSKAVEESKKSVSRNSQDSKRSEKYTSLYSDLRPSSMSEITSKSDSSLLSINTRRGCSDFSKSDKLTEVLPLKEPTVSLTAANEEAGGKHDEKEDKSRSMRNITVRSDRSFAPGELNSTNEIHLKFEAEIHLLNDFNESLRQFSAVEKAFESLKSKNDNAVTVNKILHNRDTQTSIITRSSSSTTATKSAKDPQRSRSEVSTINYSRGSGVNDDTSSIHFDDTISKLDGTALESPGVEVSNVNRSVSSAVRSSADLSNIENLRSNNCAEMTLKMFDQLIRDEDVRLENLKTILKIREQALLDRTKGELAWLEIQRKHLRETGKLDEASLVKKKQRGILVHHQREKHEMQRLKQMQKAASLERKIILKEQRNLIKHQLSTDTMLSKMKLNPPRERRLSGPLKVIQSHSESIRSETSISKRSSSEKDVYSITSHTHSVVSKVSEVSAEDVASKEGTQDADPVSLASRLASESGIPVSQMKKTLLMREVALQKRRRAAEELLQWHKKLLEEEKRITELESTANAIISCLPSDTSPTTEKYRFRGRQLNQLWFNLTGCEEKKFSDDKVYPMSQISLERFCKSAREYSAKTKKLLRKASDSDFSEARTDDSVGENIPGIRVNSLKENSSGNDAVCTPSANDYSSDFDAESIRDIVNGKDMDAVDRDLNRLIDNFSKIEADISSLGIKKPLKPSKDQEDNSPHSDSELEISVIETRTSKEERISNSGNTQPDIISTSKNLSIIEEINKSTRDTLSKSEEVLLRLNQAEDSLKKLSVLEEIPSLPRPESIEEKSNTDISEIISLDKPEPEVTSAVRSSLADHLITSEGKDNLNKTEEVLEELNKTDDGTTADIPSDKKSVQVTSETTDNLIRVKEILEKLSSAEEPISSGKTSVLEENVATKETRGSLSKTEEILEKLSQIFDEDTDKKSSLFEENQINGEARDNLSKSEQILEKLSLVEQEIGIDVSSNKLSSVVEENRDSTQENSDLAETEDVLNKLSLTDDKSVADAASEVSSKEESSVAEEDKISTDIDKTISNEEKEFVAEESIVAENIEASLEPTADEESASGKYRKSENSAVDGKFEEVWPRSEERATESRTSSKIFSVTNGSSKNEETLDRVSTVPSYGGSLSLIAVEGKVHTPDMLISKENKSPSISQEKDVISGKEFSEVPLIDEEKIRTQQRKSRQKKFLRLTVKKIAEIEEDNKEQPIIEVIDNVRSDISESRAVEDDTEELKNRDIGEKVSQEISVSDKMSRIEGTVDPRNSETSQENKNSSGIQSGGSTVATKPDLTPEEHSVLTISTQEDLSHQIAAEVPTDVEESEKSNSLPSECAPLSKEEINSYEEKEQDSLSSSASSSSQSGTAANKEGVSSALEKSKTNLSEDKSSKTGAVDVKKRVSEIMAESNQPSRGDKSPRLQDLYVTTYDLVSPANSPELGSPIEEQTKLFAAKSIFGTEAEEILRKQLAIEQEIKLITEQQQKEISYMYVREIPNKPPPPYTPPSSLPHINVITIVPTTQEIEEITKYSAKILHKAYLSNGLDSISISENTLGLISKNITKECYKFVFDICKEATKAHYKQFEKEKCVSWLQVRKRPQLAVVKPLDAGGLERHLNKTLRELFGYEKPNRRENAIIKWSRKKRNHVDEILVMESQAEESQWTSYEKDELLVMNEVTNEIMNMLLKETGDVFSQILSKRTYLY